MSPGGAPRTAPRIARALVLLLLGAGVLAGCGTPSTDLCARAANQQRLGELDLAAVTYARAERLKESGCGEKGLAEVARDKADAEIAVARAQAAENAEDSEEAIANYAKALRLDVRQGTALLGLRRLIRTTRDVGAHWQIAMTYQDLGMTSEARKEVAATVKKYPREPVPEALAALAAGSGGTKAPASPGTSARPATDGPVSDVRAAQLLEPVDGGGGPGLITMFTWFVMVVAGVLFLVVVVMSRAGNDHLVPRAVATAVTWSERFAIRERLSGMPRPTPAGPAAGTTRPGAAAAPPGVPTATGNGPARGTGNGTATDAQNGSATDTQNGSANGAATNGPAATTPRPAAAEAGPVAEATTGGGPAGAPVPSPPSEPSMPSNPLVAAEVSDPTAPGFTAVPVEAAPPPTDLATAVAARPAHPSRWKPRGIRKRRAVLARTADPEELKPHLLGDGAAAPSTAGLDPAVAERLVQLVRQDRAKENALQRLSAPRLAEITTVLTSGDHLAWQALRTGEAAHLVVTDTRLYLAGDHGPAGGRLVVRQSTSAVDDAERAELLELLTPAPLEPDPWRTPRLVELLDGLGGTPGDGGWTRWWRTAGPEEGGPEGGTRVSTEEWQALVRARVPAGDAAGSLLPLLPATSDSAAADPELLRALVRDLEAPGDGLPVGRQVYAVTLVTSEDRETELAAVERSVGGHAPSQNLSRTVLDSLTSAAGPVGTTVLDLAAAADQEHDAPAVERRARLQELLGGVRQELAEAAEESSGTA